jgi:hypothetical protein
MTSETTFLDSGLALRYAFLCTLFRIRLITALRLLERFFVGCESAFGSSNAGSVADISK